MRTGGNATAHLVDEPPDAVIGPARAELRRAAIAARAITRRIVDADLSHSDAGKLREGLEELARLVAEAPVQPGVDGLRGSEGHPWVGAGNPVAPPMRFHLEPSALDVDGQALVGIVVCPGQYSGAGDVVHGGVIAGLFDAVVATRASMSGSALTVQLNVRYTAPTPTDRPLRLEGVLERTEGRKRYLTARLHAGEVLCADATAVLVATP